MKKTDSCFVSFLFFYWQLVKKIKLHQVNGSVSSKQIVHVFMREIKIFIIVHA